MGGLFGRMKVVPAPRFPHVSRLGHLEKQLIYVVSGHSSFRRDS
jgi:hypothetical protein